MRSWATLGVLSFASLLAFLDRSIFVQLLFILREDLQLNDTQVGFLGGGAFSITVALLSVPMGVLSDGMRDRRRVLSLAMMFWSLGMVVCGLSTTFIPIALARACVGIGESALMPCAMSLIYDSFAPGNRAKAFGIFGVAPFVGTGVAYAISGGIIAFSTSSVPLPLIGWVIRGWGLVFILLGLAGFVYPLLFFLIREDRLSNAGWFSVSWRVALSRLKQRWRPFFIYLGLAFLIGVLLSAWGAFGLILWHSFGIDIRTAAFVLSILDPAAGLAGAASAGYWADRLSPERFRLAGLSIMSILCFVCSSALVVRPFVTNAIGAYFLYGIQQFALCGVIGLAFDFLQTRIALENTHALAAGLGASANNLGFVLGPLVTGILSDATSKLWMSLLIVSCITGVALTSLSIVFRLKFDALINRGEDKYHLREEGFSIDGELL